MQIKTIAAAASTALVMGTLGFAAPAQAATTQITDPTGDVIVYNGDLDYDPANLDLKQIDYTKTATSLTIRAHATQVSGSPVPIENNWKVLESFQFNFKVNGLERSAVIQPGGTGDFAPKRLWAKVAGISQEMPCSGLSFDTTSNSVSVTVPLSCLGPQVGKVTFDSVNAASNIMNFDGLGYDEASIAAFAPFSYSLVKPVVAKKVSVKVTKIKKRTVTAKVSANCGQTKVLQKYKHKTKKSKAKWVNVRVVKGKAKPCAKAANFTMKAKSKGTYRIVVKSNKYSKQAVSRNFKIKR